MTHGADPIEPPDPNDEPRAGSPIDPSERPVVSLYDESGIMVRPWAEVGFQCICVDVQHRPMRRARVERVGKGSITYQWGDVRVWVPPRRPFILFAFPPCTHVAVCNARDFKMKGTALLRDSLEMFSAAYHAGMWAAVPYMIENPVGKFSDHMREADEYFQPWMYGDLWWKKTCLWTGNGFVMPPKRYITPPAGTTQKIHHMAPGKDRGMQRSKTPPRFAHAIFDANCPAPLRGDVRVHRLSHRLAERKPVRRN
jgi:hypothetical protein